MLLHAPALACGQAAGLEQDPVGDADLADVVQKEAPLEARIVEKRRRDLEREPRRVARNPAGVAARPEVARLQRRREHCDGLRVGLGQKLVLAAADLDQPVQICGVDNAAALVGVGAGPLDHRRDEAK